MQINSVINENVNHNPIDLLEDAVLLNNWSYNRTDSNTLFAEVRGGWCDYHVTLAWSEDSSLLQYSWTYNLSVESKKRRLLYSLINKININLPAGHIEFWDDDGWLMYRNALTINNKKSLQTKEIDLILLSCLSQCEKYYPAFQFLLWENKSPEQALEASLLDTKGEA